MLCVCLVTSCVTITPDVSDLESYRRYITQLDNRLAEADESSFAEGERQQLLLVAKQITSALEGADSLGSLDEGQREHLLLLNSELHILLVGDNESLAAGRVCTTQVATGSNIRNRVCRTREQITGSRDQARRLLEQRQDDIERTILSQDSQSALPSFGGQ